MTPEEQAALDVKTAGVWLLVISDGYAVHRSVFNSKASALAAATVIETAMNTDGSPRMVKYNSAEGTSVFDRFSIRSVRVMNDIAYIRALQPWIVQKGECGVVPAADGPVTGPGG